MKYSSNSVLILLFRRRGSPKTVRWKYPSHETKISNKEYLTLEFPQLSPNRSRFLHNMGNTPALTLYRCMHIIHTKRHFITFVPIVIKKLIAEKNSAAKLRQWNYFASIETIKSAYILLNTKHVTVNGKV